VESNQYSINVLNGVETGEQSISNRGLQEELTLLMHATAASAQPNLQVIDRRFRENQYQSAMRVLTLTPFYPTASDDGAGGFIAEPLRELERLGVDSCVLAVRPLHRSIAKSSPSTRLATWARYPSIPGGIGLASSGAFLYASLISRVRKLHQGQRIDLIHAHAALPCGHAAVLLSQELNIPCIVTVHGLDAYFDNQVHGYAGEWCKRVARFVYRSASRVVCISDKVAKRVVDGADGVVNTKVIYNGVDAQMFSPASTDCTSNTILSVGNLIPIKGHELLLQALAAVLPHYPNISCEIIGDGPERERLAGLAREYKIADKVRFLGRQSRKQVAEAMRRCLLFALPSRYEGLGCVYLEAMSAEKPVIACRGQGIDEIIRHGSNGWLVDSGNLHELTAALSVLLQDLKLRRQLGEAARRTILQGFTSSYQAAQLMLLYQECVS
jgi:teichuronic acid biosynthesis glycosyltransferase TuaC